MESERIQQLMRPSIRALTPYSSARNEFSGHASIFIDANENFTDFIGGEGRNRYPDPKHVLLKKSIEETLGFASDRIVLGNGSDEIIDLLFRIFCEPKEDRVVLLPPTYGAYQVFADINDVGITSIPLTATYDLDMKAIRERMEELNTQGSKMLFICSPNNPSGNSFPLAQIQEIASLFQGITVVDEAYIDFSEQESAASLIDDNGRIVVLRTLSKAWGLANVRIGFAIADPQIVRIMHHVKYPYNLSGIQQETAVRALAEKTRVHDTVRQIVSERERIASFLPSLSYVEEVYHSDANFILVKVLDADLLYTSLLKKGIIIRNRSRVIGCSGCVRITVGSRDENDTLLTALKELEEVLA